MDPFWFEVVKTAASTITAIAAVVGVIIATRGLDKWRAEATGKLRIELAEGVLADFYEARDIIQAARSRPSSGSEPSTRKREPYETDVMSSAYDALYFVGSRLENKSEFFSKFHSRRYRFWAHFGPEAAKPFEEVRGVYDEIVGASLWLSRVPLGGMGDVKYFEKLKSITQPQAGKEDEIAKRLDAAVAQIEQTCRPIIQEGVRGLVQPR
jgi:hypothetical protein